MHRWMAMFLGLCLTLTSLAAGGGCRRTAGDASVSDSGPSAAECELARSINMAKGTDCVVNADCARAPGGPIINCVHLPMDGGVCGGPGICFLLCDTYSANPGGCPPGMDCNGIIDDYCDGKSTCGLLPACQ